MMRKESITTTMDYYVGHEADMLNFQIRASLNPGATLDATSNYEAAAPPVETPQTS
jgi:hypothetical protein